MKKIFLSLLFINSTLTFAEITGPAPSFKPPMIVGVQVPGIDWDRLSDAETSRLHKLISENRVVTASASHLLDMTGFRSPVFDLTGYDANAEWRFLNWNESLSVREYLKWYLQKYGNRFSYTPPLIVIPFSADKGENSLVSRLNSWRRSNVIARRSVIAMVVTPEDLAKRPDFTLPNHIVLYVVQGDPLEVTNKILSEASNRNCPQVRRILLSGDVEKEVTRFAKLATSLPYELGEETSPIHVDLIEGGKGKYYQMVPAIAGLSGKNPSLIPNNLELSLGGLVLHSFSEGFKPTLKQINFSESTDFYEAVWWNTGMEGVLHRAEQITVDVLKAKIAQVDPKIQDLGSLPFGNEKIMRQPFVTSLIEQKRLLEKLRSEHGLTDPIPPVDK